MWNSWLTHSLASIRELAPDVASFAPPWSSRASVVRTIRETRQFVEVVKQDGWINVRFSWSGRGSVSAVALFKRCHGRSMMTNGERQKKKLRLVIRTCYQHLWHRPCVYHSIFIWDNEKRLMKYTKFKWLINFFMEKRNYLVDWYFINFYKLKMIYLKFQIVINFCYPIRVKTYLIFGLDKSSLKHRCFTDISDLSKKIWMW